MKTMMKLIYNAKVYIAREVFSEAVLINGDHILAVGSSVELLKVTPECAKRINAKGNVLIPGFYDSHVHMAMAGREAMSIQADAPSIEELIQRGQETINKLNTPEGTIVTGFGWDNEKMGRNPTRFDLDMISNKHAIILSRHCGHAICCNTLALELAGIADQTQDGILQEQEADPVWNLVPQPTIHELKEFMKETIQAALKLGITSVASNDIKGDDAEHYIQAFQQLFQEHKNRIRVTEQCAIRNEADLDDYINKGFYTGLSLIPGFLKIGPLKLFEDGSLGSKTALLRNSYCDAPETKGICVLEPDLLNTYVKKANDNGLQVAIHAIGDGAIDAVITSFEAVTSRKNNPLRHSIIHCQITDMPLLSRMEANDMLAIIQPVFLKSDHSFIANRVGSELAATSYAWNTMERIGIKTAYSTDCPVERLSPFANISAALLRDDSNTEECVDVYTAVDAYTAGSAFANFDELRLGRIKSGMLADMIVLDTDIFTVPSEQIANTKVLMTILGGEIVYQSDDFLHNHE